MLWLTRRITATLAADGPIASTPAASVAAWAVTPRRARSALDLAYCSLNPPACSGTIIAAARSTAAAGALGENDATVSAIPVARCTTSRESRLKSRSGVVQRRYPVTTAAEIAAAHRKTTASRSPGASSSVPTVTESRRNSQKLIATPSTTSSTNTEHVETHHRGPQTRQRALAKLNKFTAKVGYPIKWRDYSKLAIDRDDLYGNVQRGYAVNHDRELAKLFGPVDRDEWFMTPQTVNAYYNPGMNEIVFPAAILQPPFFDPQADEAANYGGIGAVIGHEIGHGFDDQGAKYDGDGNLVDWWTDDDRTEFAARTKALIEQYHAYTPRDLVDHPGPPHVQGAFTIGENIGDLGGLSIALLAYQLSLNGNPAPVIDGLTGMQRVFFGWAQIWRTKSRAAEAIRRLAVDPHSPPEFRCNGVVRNVDAFYQAFDVTEDDALFLDPQRRVRIWN